MKKTMNLDAELLARARKASGAKNDTDTVKRGLEELIRRDAYRILIDSTGCEPDAQDVPRRREPAWRARPKRRGAAAGRR